MADLVERFLSDFLPNKKRPPRPTTIKDYYAHFAPDALKKAADARAQAMQELVEEVARAQRTS